MDEYINNETIVKDSIYELFKNSATCELCHNIFINPIMCMKCQNSYCQKCIDNLDKNNEICPNKCNEPTFNKSLSKNDILSKFKFKCRKCGIEYFYHEIKKHCEACNSSNIQSSVKEKKGPKLKKITVDEIDKRKKEGIEVEYITGKKYF